MQNHPFARVQDEAEIAVSFGSESERADQLVASVYIRDRLAAVLKPNARPGWSANARADGPVAQRPMRCHHQSRRSRLEGRCVKRWIGPVDGSAPTGATYFYYDGWNLIQEGPSAGSAARQYIHGARVDEIVKQITPTNGVERFFHYDARIHCTLQTDTSANVVEQYEYGVFGKPYYYDRWGNNIGHSPWGNRFLFTGREWLSDLQIYDYRHRLYQPEMGRFLQPDPTGFAAGDYNLYRYCHNDPVNKTDPFGLEFRGEHVPFQFVPTVPGEYGHTAFDVKAVVGYFPTEGGFSLRTTRLDVTILSRQVATEVKVAGEQRARPRTDEAIAATVKHEGLHGTDAKKFHDANQNRSFPGVFKSPSEAKKAASEAGKQLQREFKESQKHTPPEKWKDILRKESFR